MISLLTLKYLISNKIKDAETLLENNRFPTSIYLAGYAIEIALKYKICRFLHFVEGFPETKQELNNYLTFISKHNLQPLIININDIRNHDLNKLLIYSGAELTIKTNFLNEWAIVNQWNPENRYRKLRIVKKTAENYLDAVKELIRKIN